jgi:uncharacterized membrane protein (Fun14 family)
MTLENILPVVTMSGGTFLASFLIGYFVKKIVKILMFVLGGILALLIYMQSKGIINVEVNVNKIQSSTVDVINTISANTAAIFPTDNSPSILDSSLGIPVSGSVTAGFMLGITRRG